MMNHYWNLSKSVGHFSHQVDGLVQDCSISIANALEILQSCTKPLECTFAASSVSYHQSDISEVASVSGKK